MKIRNLFLPAIVIVPSVFIYGLISLKSDNFHIKKDERLLAGKSEYLSAPANPADSVAPNILWIIVDDLSLADTDLYNENAPVHVPHMKRLASEGVRFTNAYVSASTCSPSRASMLTGRYNQRFGFEHQLHERYLKNRLEYYGFKYLIESGPWVPQEADSVPSEDFMREMGIPLSEIMLPEILEKRGYASGYVGKWHVGKKKENSPNAFGYTEFYGFTSSHTLYVPEGTPGYVDQKIDDDFTDEYIWDGQRDGLHAIQRNGTVIEEDRYMTTAITDESIAYIRNHPETPFHLHASYTSPHTPLQAPESYVAQFAHETDPVKRVHYAMIKNLDDEVGRLLAFLDESGLTDNTLVFLISDNGGAEYNLTTSNGDYQGGKITNFEGGVKVPMLMRWPGHVPAGADYTHPVHATDLLVTSAASAAAQLPTDRIYDGADLVRAVNSNLPAHEYIYFKMGFNGGVRNDSWKLTWNTDNGDTLLFNLDSDPYEQHNLYHEGHPATDELTRAYNEWMKDNKPPSWPPVMHYYYTADDGSVYYFDQ